MTTAQPEIDFEAYTEADFNSFVMMLRHTEGPLESKIIVPDGHTMETAVNGVLLATARLMYTMRQIAQHYAYDNTNVDEQAQRLLQSMIDKAKDMFRTSTIPFIPRDMCEDFLSEFAADNGQFDTHEDPSAGRCCEIADAMAPKSTANMVRPVFDIAAYTRKEYEQYSKQINQDFPVGMADTDDPTNVRNAPKSGDFASVREIIVVGAARLDYTLHQLRRELFRDSADGEYLRLVADTANKKFADDIFGLVSPTMHTDILRSFVIGLSHAKCQVLPDAIKRATNGRLYLSKASIPFLTDGTCPYAYDGRFITVELGDLVGRPEVYQDCLLSWAL
jgi:hypothetical protein